MGLSSTFLVGDVHLINRPAVPRRYEQGGNVGRLEELLDVGQGLGLPRGPLQGALLAGNAGTLREAVLERDAAAKQR